MEPRVYGVVVVRAGDTVCVNPHKEYGMIPVRQQVLPKKELILLVGPSGSGKDHVINALGLDRVVSRTTRAPRVNEQPGVDKHFRTLKDYLDDKKRGEVVAYTYFDGAHYWARRSDLLARDVYVIDPAGVEYFAQHGRYPYRVVIITAPWYRRLRRMLGRGDGLVKAVRRLLHDRRAFGNLRGSHETIRT